MKLKLRTHIISRSGAALRLIGLPLLGGLFLAGTLLRAAVPADPAVEMLFSEGPGYGNGLTTTNQGSLGGLGTFYDLQGTNVFPAFSTNVPVGAYVPFGNSYCLDLGTFVAGAGGRAVDLATTGTPPGNGTMGAFTSLTVCGWVNARTFSVRGQIAYALESPGGLGFSLAHNSIGKLGLGINQNSGNAPASSFSLPTDGNAGTNNWVFFAATYDPSLSSGQLKYYIGRPNKLAALDSTFDYLGGDTTSSNIDFSGPLTVANQSPADSGNRDTESNAGNALFRGMMDEIKVYTNAFTLDQVQQAQINAAVTPVGPTILTQPANKTTPEGQNALFEVGASGSGLLSYQWKTNGVNVLNATNASFTISNVTLAQIGTLVRVGVTNSVNGVLSSNATLTVVPANPHVISLSFTEGIDRTTNWTITSTSQDTTGGLNTANVGILGGGSHIKQASSSGNAAGTWPVFSANVPSGPFAPSPTFNRLAMHMGDVLYSDFASHTFPGGQGNRALDFTNSVASPANTLGKMSGLTICGWINPGSLTWRGTVGNQLACAIDSANANGFGLAHKSDDSLQLAVNEQVGNATANRSSPSMLQNNTNHPPANWIFFAVTYDGSLTETNLNYYFGDPNNAATNDVLNPLTYNRGIVNSTGPLTVGCFNLVTPTTGRLINGENAVFFRGLIDEFHVFSRVLTLAEIQQIQVAPPIPPVLLISSQTNNIVLSWAAGAPPLVQGIQLQSRTNLAIGAWADVPDATNVSGNVRSLALPQSGTAKFFRLRTQ